MLVFLAALFKNVVILTTGISMSQPFMIQPLNGEKLNWTGVM